jgi:TPP-dependent pyruvate/acetoin dehydrogenase alpha subunit
MAGKVEEAEAIHSEMVESLYEEMYRIRVFETLLVPHIQSGEIKTPCHLCIGQEAVAVGVCEALKPQDYVFGNHRSHGHYLAKGGDMRALACEIFGKAEGCSRGYGGSMHICDPAVNFMGSAFIVGGTIGLAVGAAMAAKLRGEDRVSVAFFGDGATNEGVFYESMNIARLYNLPVIFVCENNGYSTHMKVNDCLSSQPYLIAEGLGYDAHCIDGNDPLSVYQAVALARSWALTRVQPRFVECTTYRLCGHVGPNDNVAGQQTDIRPEAEVKEAWRREPLANWSNFTPMVKAGEIYNEIAEIIEYARKADYPEKGSYKKHVFAD